MKYIIIGLFYFTFFINCLYPQKLPLIQNLNNRDPIFKALIKNILENQRLIASGKSSALDLKVFTYLPKKSDTLHNISARLNLPYDTIATLNNISSPVLFSNNEILYLPNMAGLAVRHDNYDPFLIHVRDMLKNEKNIEILLPNLSNESQTITTKFYPNQRFSSSIRTTFLVGLFWPPLKNTQIVITSEFGKRNSPTQKNQWEFHPGIDYRAPLHSKVHASRFGNVKKIGFDKVLGLYVILQHENNLQTIYGHLSQIFVKENDIVTSGKIIAESGNTGRTTGPHLHFEIRKKGESINPRLFFKKN